MYKVCKTEQSAARQRELECALLAAMGRRPFDEISISDLCTGAGIPRKSFYRYFSSKDGALLALLDHTLMELEIVRLSADATARMTLEEHLEALFQYWLEQKPLLDALQRSHLEALLVQRAIHLSTSNSGIFPGQWTNPQLQGPGDYSVTFFVCGIMSAVLRWYRQDFRETPAQMARIIHTLLTRPMLLDSGVGI